VTSRSRPISDGEELIASLRRQPLLVVFRPEAPLQLAPLLEPLQALGLVHVELACLPRGDWSRQCRDLVTAFPSLRIGGASIVSREALRAALEAGLSYGVSPVLDPALLEEAAALGFPLVPGVMTPTEVQTGTRLGPGLVKLFPASTLGPSYWSRLREPLGGALPFCIAAGGLGPAEVSEWLSAGVDAVAVGSRWLGIGTTDGTEGINVEPLRALLEAISLQTHPSSATDNRDVHPTHVSTDHHHQRQS
jgi:2-dehydro-3-deoxyphosphogluconate aldolase/(4S)-4-hydroxy-2-oxoglutarate aldolase